MIFWNLSKILKNQNLNFSSKKYFYPKSETNFCWFWNRRKRPKRYYLLRKRNFGRLFHWFLDAKSAQIVTISCENTIFGWFFGIFPKFWKIKIWISHQKNILIQNRRRWRWWWLLDLSNGAIKHLGHRSLFWSQHAKTVFWPLFWGQMLFFRIYICQKWTFWSKKDDISGKVAAGYCLLL